MLIKGHYSLSSGRVKNALMLDNSTLWRVGFARFTGSIGMGFIIPFMALFLYSVEGISPYAIGAIFSITYLTGMLFQPIGGHISDKYGEKITLTAGLLISSSLYFTIWVLVSLDISSISIITAYVMASLGSSLTYSPYYSLITKSSMGRPMKKTFGIFRVIFNLGFIIGPVAGSIVSVYRFDDIFFFASIFRLLELIVLIFVVKYPIRKQGLSEHNAEKADPGEVTHINRKLLFFSLSVMFLAMVGTQIYVSLPIFAFSTGGITIAEYGYIYSLNGLVVVAGQFLINRIFSKIGDIRSMFAGIVLYMVAFMIAGFSHAFLPLVGLIVIYSMGEDIVAPLENAIVGNFAPSEKIGLYISVKSAFWSAGNVIGPAVGSIIIFLLPYGPLVSWGIMDMFGGLSMIMLLAFRKQVRIDLRGSAAAV